ncbi:hypothetical protein C0992_010392, partial [Termitomyces sp. T32_za158]
AALTTPHPSPLGPRLPDPAPRPPPPTPRPPPLVPRSPPRAPRSPPDQPQLPWPREQSARSPPPTADPGARQQKPRARTRDQQGSDDDEPPSAAPTARSPAPVPGTTPPTEPPLPQTTPPKTGRPRATGAFGPSLNRGNQRPAQPTPGYVLRASSRAPATSHSSHSRWQPSNAFASCKPRANSSTSTAEGIVMPATLSNPAACAN